MAGGWRGWLVAVMAGFVVGGALAGSTQSLPRAAPEDVGLSAAALQDGTALLHRFVDDRKIAGAVAAVARHGRLVYLESVGVQDLETRTPMSERSIFRIYSMTKPVTSVAVMMLQEEGRLDLDDPVAAYLPEFAGVRVFVEPGGATRPPAREMTIRDLLLNTSGLSHRTSALYREAQVRSRDIPLTRFVENIVRVPLMEDPGTRFRYSEATTVLGRLVELWSGQPFDRFLEERLFRPLGMADTSFVVRPDQRSRLATVYGPAEDGGLRPVDIEEVPFTEPPALLEGAVGLVSTVPDFLRFSQMLLNGGELDGVRILEPATVRAITGNGLSPDVLAQRGGSMGWGLANVNVVIDPSALAYPAAPGEYGWDGSAGTIFWIDPGRELVTILMTQSSPANPDSLRQQFKTLVERAVS